MAIKTDYFDNAIAKYQRRVDKIGASPDPKRLKSNLQVYAAELEYKKGQLEAWKAGEPFATGMMPPTLLRAMGFHIYDSEMAADRLTRDEVAVYTRRCRESCLPEQVCDRTILNRPLVSDGFYPKLSLIVPCNWECENIPLGSLYLAHTMDTPCYYLDIPYETSEETLRYVYEQLKELVAFAESKVPGIKYSDEKLAELQQIEREWYQCYRLIYDLKKRKPCPMPSEETFKEPRWPSLYENPRQYLDAFKIYTDELKERVDKGVGAVAEEKLRVLWAITGPFYARPTPWEVIEERGVVAVYYQIGNASRTAGSNPAIGIYGEEREYGRKMRDPLEEEAMILNQSAWGGLGQRWINDILITCRDMGIEAIVYFRQWGCTVTENQGKLVADAAERELGIPTQILDGRLLIDEMFDQKKLEEDLNNFIDVCFARKGIH